MKLSKTELQIMEQIANGNKNIKEIAKALKKSNAQIYRSGQKLIKKSFIEKFHGLYEPKRNTHIILLLQLLSQEPSMITSIADCGIDIFTEILEPKSIYDIIKDTG